MSCQVFILSAAPYIKIPRITGEYRPKYIFLRASRLSRSASIRVHVEDLNGLTSNNNNNNVRDSGMYVSTVLRWNSDWLVWIAELLIVCCCTRILLLWCYGTLVDCTCTRVIHRTVVVCTVRWYVGTLDTLTNRNIPVVLLTRYSLSQRTA